MNLQSLINRFDTIQQQHPLSAIIFGVIRKFGDDNAAYLVALLTYYAFLSLFPLLLAVTSLIAIAASYHLPFAANASAAVVAMIPFFGHQLEQNVHGLKSSGVSLAIGIVLAFYGARGVADVFRFAVNEVWQIPKSDRAVFPADIISSLKIILVGGGGFLLSSSVAGLLSGLGKSLALTLLGIFLSLGIIYLTLLAILKIASPKYLTLADMRRGAIGTAIGFQLLQLLGGLFLTHTLHRFNTTYGAFALVLGLIFYISLQSQFLIYSLEYNVVMRRRLWPRSLTLTPTTPADETTLSGQAKKESLAPSEDVKVGFKD